MKCRETRREPEEQAAVESPACNEAELFFSDETGHGAGRFYCTAMREFFSAFDPPAACNRRASGVDVAVDEAAP